MLAFYRIRISTIPVFFRIWISDWVFGLGWFRIFPGQDSGFFNRFQDFRDLVFRDSVLVFRTWTVSDFSGFGCRG